jgi:hypothetical protein
MARMGLLVIAKYVLNSCVLRDRWRCPRRRKGEPSPLRSVLGPPCVAQTHVLPAVGAVAKPKDYWSVILGDADIKDHFYKLARCVCRRAALLAHCDVPRPARRTRPSRAILALVSGSSFSSSRTPSIHVSTQPMPVTPRYTSSRPALETRHGTRPMRSVGCDGPA